MTKIHGGKRPGAGRKHGSGRYGEATTVIRVPVSEVSNVREYLSAKLTGKSTSNADYIPRTNYSEADNRISGESDHFFRSDNTPSYPSKFGLVSNYHFY